MSNSNSSIGSSDISKMKVAELKKELKTRGLSTVGTKNELVERLQSAGPEIPQDTTSEFDNTEPDVLDEDEVLGGVEETTHWFGGEEIGDVDDEVAEAVLPDEPKAKTEAAGATQKRSLSQTAEASQQPQPKKRVLIRPTSVTSASGKENGSQEKAQMEVEDEGKPDSNEKKVVKISTVSLKERLALRAQKFGLPLSDSAKKQARAERFGVAPSAVKSSTISGATKVVLQSPSEEVLKKRAARFGCNVSSSAIKVEENDKIKKRQERFGGLSAASVDNLEEKKKRRAERFQL